jgi:lipopolysaccharide/colanic/teichoic acid biosynthesis glycosyltransferase
MQEPEVRETVADGPRASKIRLVARSYRAPVGVSAAEDAWWRRVLERIAAVILLVIFAPTMLLVALAIKIESPGGPVFYKQERVGLNRRRGEQPKASSVSVRGERRRNRGEGKPFKIWKFRTMVPDAEKKTGPVWASQDDPRVTRVGNFLRKTRLDELPQLMNVVQGEMRLVGPRPERPHFVERLVEGVPDYRWRLTVPPGITGLAQVERSYDEDLDDVRTKLKYDIFYIENRRPILDFKILLKTLSVVVGRRGAR